MSIDLLENQEDVIPIYDAFGRDVPEDMERPERLVEELLSTLDGQVRELEALAKQPGAEKTAKRAGKLRGQFEDLEKRALKEMDRSAKKDEATKKLEKITQEIVELTEEVTAELTVPVRETGVTKALETLKKRKDNTSKGKIDEFEKKRDTIAKEDDPKKRCNLYFQLERNIIKADLLAREEEDPGSTWQDQVEIALQDAKPIGRMAKAGNKLGSIKDKIVSKVSGRSTEAISDEEFLALKKGFVNSYAKKIQDMAFSVPDESRSEFLSKAGTAMANLGDETFVLQNKPKDQQALGKCLVQAQTKALQELAKLKRDYPPNVTPQVNVHDGKIIITKAAPKPESLVLQGGGGKGSGYPPLLEEMHKSGLLKDVKLLVGTSIGALNASCLACGGLSDEREILNINIVGQAYTKDKFKKQYPGVSFEAPFSSKKSKFVNALLPTCAGEMAKMDQLMSGSVADNLKQYSENDLSSELSKKLSKLDDETLENLGLAGASSEVIEQEVMKLAKKVKNQDFKASDRTTQMITFKDLAILNKLDPVNFKELCITGWEGTGPEGHEVYFNAKDFPDMPVALAARISMGLPIFSPVYWDNRGPFFDGGLGSNSPVEATPGIKDLYTDENGEPKDPGDVEDELKGDVPVQVQEAMAKTMLMTFDDEGKGSRNLYGEGRDTTEVSMGEKITLVKSGIQPGYGKTLESDAKKVYNTGLNTLQVYHGDQGTLALGALTSPEATEYSETMSRLKGLEQLDQRQDQAAQVSCTNTDEAMLGMTSAEKRKLVAAGKPPQGSDPLVLELYDKCEQYLLLESGLDNIGDDAAPFLQLAATTPLCASAKGAIETMLQNYNVHVKGESSPEALNDGIKAVTKAVAECPAFLRPMMKKAALIPMQQKRRNLPRTDNSGFEFVWQQKFSAEAFDTSMNVAAKNSVFTYLKEAKAACSELKSYESRNKDLGEKKKPKDICEAARKALASLESFLVKLRTMGKAPAYQVIPTMQKYIKWLEENANPEMDRLRSIARGKDAQFPAHTFKPWDKKDWQEKKELAIANGVIEDPKGTGFSSLMEKAESASASYDRAQEEAKPKAGKIAWNAWDKFIRVAKQIQGLSENSNFTKYLEGCITLATDERDRFPAT